MTGKRLKINFFQLHCLIFFVWSHLISIVVLITMRFVCQNYDFNTIT